VRVFLAVASAGFLPMSLAFSTGQQAPQRGKTRVSSQECTVCETRANKNVCSAPCMFGDCLKFRALQIVCLSSVCVHYKIIFYISF